MIDDLKKLDLQAVGTRYDHYMELKEIFMSGVEIINQLSQGTFVTEGDKRTKAKLQVAIELITRRIDNLSGFNENTGPNSPIARQVRAAGVHKTPLLMEGSDGKPKDITGEGTTKD